MRKNLGRFLVASILLWHVGLFASTYEWRAEISKKDAYINESIHLKYVCEFSDRGELYTIDFNPLGEKDNYTLELLKKSEKFIDAKRVSSFEYIAHAKRAGELEFNFDVKMKKTTLAFIVESTGSRDDDRGDDDFSQKIIRQKILSVNVKESKRELVGDFSIDIQSDKAEIKAYEPYHLNIKLKGNGNFQALKPIEFKIDGVKVFQENPIKNLELSKDGYVGMWSQKFAFVSEKDFKIPVVKIEYFNPKSQSLKSLTTESLEVKVTQGFKKEELLDDKVENELLNFNFIYYILTFITGFLVAKIKFKIKNIDAKDKLFIQKIKNKKSLNELSTLLILNDNKKFEKLILEIESNVVTSLSQAKKMAENIYTKGVNE